MSLANEAAEIGSHGPSVSLTSAKLRRLGKRDALSVRRSWIWIQVRINYLNKFSDVFMFLYDISNAVFICSTCVVPLPGLGYFYKLANLPNLILSDPLSHLGTWSSFLLATFTLTRALQ